MAYLPVREFTDTGELQQPLITKAWSKLIDITTANGQTVDISSAGFTQIINYFVTTMRDVATAEQTADVKIKSVSLTQVVLNTTTPNIATVQILGINVMAGAPLIFPASTTGVKAYLRIEGR